MGAAHPLPPDVVETLLASRERFLAFLRKRVDSAETAEDILQSAFARGIERGGDLRDDESAVAWFYRVLRHAVIDHYRTTAAQTRLHERVAREIETVEIPEGDLRNEVCGCLRPALQELKPEYREALELVDIGGIAVRDYAVRAAITPNNAAVRVHRARAALRKQVVAACGVCATHGCVDCRCAGTERQKR